MESRIRVLFLAVVAFGLTGRAATKNPFGFGEEETPPPAEIIEGQVVEPEVDRREIKEPKIDSEDFEVGAFVGILSIEAINALDLKQAIMPLRLTGRSHMTDYHITITQVVAPDLRLGYIDIVWSWLVMTRP